MVENQELTLLAMTRESAKRILTTAADQTTRKGRTEMKRIMMLVLCGAILSSTVMAFAADDVYATKNGKKYHKEDCPLVKSKHPEKIAKEQATQEGLKPCQKCFKEDLSANEQKTEKQSKASKGRYIDGGVKS